MSKSRSGPTNWATQTTAAPDPGEACVSLCPSVSPSQPLPHPQARSSTWRSSGTLPPTTESQQPLGACGWVPSGESLSLTTPSQGLILEQTQAVLCCI